MERGGSLFEKLYRPRRSIDESSSTTLVGDGTQSEQGLPASSSVSLQASDSVFQHSSQNLAPAPLTANTTSMSRHRPGLTPITCPRQPSVDIIFIHGLGGSSQSTWYHDHDSTKFWPAWLVQASELQRARIHMFGYAANIIGAKNASTIYDFANDLVFQMRYQYSSPEKGPPIGSVPIIFIAHSMGGLVAKKAYLLGCQTEKTMMAQVISIIFLSTPHAGSSDVSLLSKLLSVCNLRKEYVKQLSTNGTFLQEINRDFSTGCERLKLFSFYETAQTSIAGYGYYIVDKYSGMMNLPNEKSDYMPRDHHNVCKFPTPEDAYFKTIQNILVDLVIPFKDEVTVHILAPPYPEVFVEPIHDREEQLRRLEFMLGISENELANELDRFRYKAQPGTCQWIYQREWFRDWLIVEEGAPKVLWINGSPAAGKSVLAVSVVEHIRKTHGNGSCQYHNLDFADRSKRSASYLLRSFAYQIASENSAFRKSLIDIADTFKFAFQDMNATLLWERVFSGSLLRLTPERPLYWIIDGLDESDSIPTIFHCMAKIKEASYGLNILLVSRHTGDIKRRVAELPLPSLIHVLTNNDTREDIRLYVKSVVQAIIPEKFQQSVNEKILSKASGSFLWVSLVLKDLEDNRHRERDIDRVISHLPSGMNTMYTSMIGRLGKLSQDYQRLAELILTWVTFAYRPLSLPELEKALKTMDPDMDLISLEDSIHHICCGFVQVRKTKINLVHETAKPFLSTHTSNHIQMTPFRCHKKLALACLQLLSSRNVSWRTLLKHIEDKRTTTQQSSSATALIESEHPLLLYSAKYWAYHLSLTEDVSGHLETVVSDFFKKDTLTWINVLALSGDLKNVIRSAQYLKKFIKKRDKNIVKTAPVHTQGQGIKDLNPWVEDISRLVGKFGSNLLLKPSSVYKLVPPFCPESSMIRRYFEKSNSSFSIVGISNPDWDDCLARLAIDPELSASKVVATDEIVAVIVPSGHELVIWHSETCEEFRRLLHGEYLTNLAVSKKGDLICTSGTRTIKIWDVGSGMLMATTKKESNSQVAALAFGADGDEILVGYQDYLIMRYNWKLNAEVKRFHAFEEGREFLSDATVMAFSPERTHVALGSRVGPVEIWDLRREIRTYRSVVAQDAIRPETEQLLPPDGIQWHPNLSQLFILYHNTRLVVWNPTHEEQTEHAIGARDMICSPDGNLLLTSDVRGTLKVFSIGGDDFQQETKFRLLYQLDYDELVRDLAFHPNCQRFYDVRGPVCNVWEPAVLVRPEGQDAEELSSNEASSTTSDPVEALQDVTQITALACAPGDFGYCCGWDDGSLAIHEMRQGNRLRQFPPHTADTAITSIVWSASGNTVAYADDSGSIYVRRIQLPTQRMPKLSVWKASDFRVDDEITQLLVSGDDKFLLVSGSQTDTLWDISGKFVCQSRETDERRTGRWIEHPRQPSQLILLEPTAAHIYEWANLRPLTSSKGLEFFQTAVDAMPSAPLTNESPLREVTSRMERASLDYSRPLVEGALQTIERAEAVVAAVSTRDEDSIIFETLLDQRQNHQDQRRRRLRILRTSALRDPSSTNAIELHDALSGLAGRVSRLVGTFQNKIVFFDNNYWLCSREIKTSIQSSKEHLFLPKDWLNMETLRLTVLTPRGALLCPRNGEVAIIRADIGM